MAPRVRPLAVWIATSTGCSRPIDNDATTTEFADEGVDASGSTRATTTVDPASSDASSSEESGPLPDPDCACVPPLSYGSVLHEPDCAPVTCSVTAYCDPQLDPSTVACLDGPGATYDDAQIDCALEALRIGTPGVITWIVTDGGFAGNDGYVVIFEDGRVMTQRHEWFDYSNQYCDALLGQLPPPSQFEACLALPTPSERLVCLAFDPDSPVVTCGEGDDPYGYCR